MCRSAQHLPPHYHHSVSLAKVLGGEEEEVASSRVNANVATNHLRVS